MQPSKLKSWRDHHFGERIVTDEHYTEFAKGNKSSVQGLGRKLSDSLVQDLALKLSDSSLSDLTHKCQDKRFRRPAKRLCHL